MKAKVIVIERNRKKNQRKNQRKSKKSKNQDQDHKTKIKIKAKPKPKAYFPALPILNRDVHVVLDNLMDSQLSGHFILFFLLAKKIDPSQRLDNQFFCPLS